MKILQLPSFLIHCLFLTSRVDAVDITNVQNSEKSANSDKLLRRGFKNWEERCLVNGGRAVLEEYLAEQESLVFCMMEQFDLQEILSEVGRNRKSSELDSVLRKYCNAHIPAARDCLARFLGVSRHCLKEREQAGLNVTLDMVDSAIQFICHRDGDRVALFLAEQGAECLTSRYSEILTCVNKSVPEIFRQNNQHRRRNRIHFYVFQQQNCRKGDAIMMCVEQSLSKCPDPTPANLVQGLLQAMRDVTPCTTSQASQKFRPSSTVLAVTVGAMIAGAAWRL